MSFGFDLTLDIPDNIQEISSIELVNWAGERIKPAGNFTPVQVLNILNNIFMRVGLKLDNEQLLFLLDDSKRVLCEASAGSGKTTVSQLKMIKFKLLYGYSGSDILAIAYNDHAAIDMQKRHTVLIEQIMSQRISGVKLDDRIVCRTFHSNALAWVTEYASKCGISNKDTIIISDANTEKFMTKALESALKKYNEGKERQITVESLDPSVIPNLISYLGYIEETMMNVEDSEFLPKFMEIGLDVDVVAETVNRFNKLCDFNSMYTFSNILVKFYNLLKNNDDIRVRVQDAYKILLVDEYQDMTPLMNAIIALMLKEDTIFNAIGDGDQSIYSFKGTDSLNCLKFREYFPYGKVVSMGANRRCRKNIVDVARNILSINQLRYPKEIYSVNDGGSVTSRPYETSVEECEYIISELKKVPLDNLYDVCISYRNRESSLLLSKMLLDARIPFTVKSGYEPYKDMLSASLYDLYALLKQPLSTAYHKVVLYKVTPASKAQIQKVIEASSKSGEMKHYLDYDWMSLGNIGNSIVKCLTTLKECEDALKSDAPMCNYFNKVWNLFKLYYWNWVSQQTKFPADLEESVISDYNTQRGYKQFIKDYNDQIDVRDKFSRTGDGVTLTTFHGLKGLEFSTVFLMDMDDKIFPNYDKIEKDCNGNREAEISMKEECVRLFYVACTRPKDKLIVLYNKENPSIFIDLLRPMELRTKEKGEALSLEVQEEEVDFNSLDMWDDLDSELDLDLGSDVEEDTVTVYGDEDFEDITLDDVDLSAMVVPSITEEVTATVYEDEEDSASKENENASGRPIAEYTMYMYHEPSDSYYIIEQGEPLYVGSSIDFESSFEITKEEYYEGLKNQMEDTDKSYGLDTSSVQSLTDIKNNGIKISEKYVSNSDELEFSVDITPPTKSEDMLPEIDLQPLDSGKKEDVKPSNRQNKVQETLGIFDLLGR